MHHFISLTLYQFTIVLFNLKCSFYLFSLGVVKNKMYIDQGRSLKFADLCYELANHFPPLKFQRLKFLLKCKF